MKVKVKPNLSREVCTRNLLYQRKVGTIGRLLINIQKEGDRSLPINNQEERDRKPFLRLYFEVMIRKYFEVYLFCTFCAIFV